MASCDLEYLQHHRPEALEIESLDGGVYLLFAMIGGARLPVYRDGRPMRSFGVGSMRSQLSGCACEAVYLCQSSAYDEMLNQPPSDSGNRLSIRLAPLANS